MKGTKTVPINDVYRATIAGAVDGLNFMNVFHFKQQADEVAEDAPTSLHAAIDTIMVPAWKAMLSHHAVLQSVVCRKIMPAGSQPSVFNITTGTGTVIEDAEPCNVAVCASHYTATLSRMGRGRTYFSGLPQGHIQGAVPKASWVTLFEAFRVIIMADMTGTGSLVPWRWVHYTTALGAAIAIVHVEQRMQLRVLRGRTRN